MSERLVFELQAVDRATAPLKGVQTQLDRTTAAIRRNSVATDAAAVSGRKWAMGALQQAGFQIGDFAVQVANGTNKMQAFGQQAPQLLQIFGPIGAVVGAAVAIFSAFSVVAQKTSEVSVDTSKSMRELRSAVDDFRASAKLASASTEDLREDFGRLGERFRQDLEILKNLSFERAMSSLKSELSGIQVQFGDAFDMALKLSAAIEKGSPPPGWIVDAVNAARDELGMTTTQVDDLRVAIERMQSATGINEIITETERFRDKLIEVYGAAENVPGPLRVVLGLLAAARAEAAGLAASLPGPEPDGRGSQREGVREIAIMRAQERFAKRMAELRNPSRGGGRGGGGSVDPLERLREQLALEEQLLGKSQAQQRVIQALGLDWRKYGAETYEALVKQINGLEEAKARTEEMRERMQAISDTVKSSMTSAFMSIVDGTKSAKDAFREMARSIIAKLYEILVVQQMVNAISGAFGFMAGPKTGNTGTLGLPDFKAMGGPVTGGKPYIVGERGPELIVPSRNASVIPNNQMGGGGVTVVQNINISTGVQQTVRAEIKSLMPQIADSAKAAVLDAKRRGGAYGGAFA